MLKVKNCAYCGKPFLRRKPHTNQQYCCRECRVQAQNKRERERKEQIRQGNILSSVNRASQPYCAELWKEYRYFKRMMWIPEQARIERILREKGCWFQRKFGLTKTQKEIAEKRDSKIA